MKTLADILVKNIGCGCKLSPIPALKSPILVVFGVKPYEILQIALSFELLPVIIPF